MVTERVSTALSAVCPYFTMFPLEFPLEILQRSCVEGKTLVLDPFTGRGTTSYASRVLGLPSVGIDSSPVAAAISRAKLANTTPRAILQSARRVLEERAVPRDLPDGEFWEMAYHSRVLQQLCRLREGLLTDSRSEARQALRAVILGGLHGPQTKSKSSYFSNQCTRTYAPKPDYATRFWRDRSMKPVAVDVLNIIKMRSERFFSGQQRATGFIIRADSRERAAFDRIARNVSWVITSPPYYGLRTYIPDQWLRHWFVGGPSHVEYSTDGQIRHSSPNDFSQDLARVWANVSRVSKPGARMVIRFGGIADRKADPRTIIRDSLDGTSWKILTIKSAGSASSGRRQSLHFLNTNNAAKDEFDVWARHG